VLLIDADPAAVDAAREAGIDGEAGDALAAASGEMPLEDGDTVVNMLPGAVGHAARVALVQRGARLVDLAFTPESAEALDAEARSTGATVLHDVGIAPGLSNMLVAEAQRLLGDLRWCTIKVGGNPAEPDPPTVDAQPINEKPSQPDSSAPGPRWASLEPERSEPPEPSGDADRSTTDQTDPRWSYMAPFSPADVIDEYTRPVRMRRAGAIVTVPALTGRHLLDVRGRGEMEAFLTDGLRSLVRLEIDELSEYTLRWPGHIEEWLRLCERGPITPEVEATLLEAWHFDADRPEFTWLEVVAGTDTGGVRWVVEDDGDDEWSSMARMTGLVTETCCRLLHDGVVDLGPGVHPPEALPEAVLTEVLSELRGAGVRIEHERLFD